MALFLLGLFLAIPAVSNGAGPSFPSENREIRDPLCHYAIIWEEPLTQCKPHGLLLKDLRTGSLSKLLEFYRSVDVLWAPNGRFVAVTDWTGSNISQILLFQPGKKKPLNLADELRHSLGIQPEVSSNHHVHFEALSWEGDKKLRFKVFGYGDHDRNGFEHYYEYDVSGVVRKAKSE
jgi:hypothetical protein